MKNPTVPDIPDTDDERRDLKYIKLVVDNNALSTYGKVCAMVPSVHMSSSIIDDISNEIRALGRRACDIAPCIGTIERDAIEDYANEIINECDYICKNLEVYKRAITILRDFLCACVDD